MARPVRHYVIFPNATAWLTVVLWEPLLILALKNLDTLKSLQLSSDSLQKILHQKKSKPPDLINIILTTHLPFGRRLQAVNLLVQASSRAQVIQSPTFTKIWRRMVRLHKNNIQSKMIGQAISKIKYRA